jgi:hypothetical protein
MARFVLVHGAWHGMWCFAELIRDDARGGAPVGLPGPAAAIDPDWQLAIARSHRGRVIELDSGHSPFLPQPHELADLLDARA